MSRRNSFQLNASALDVFKKKVILKTNKSESDLFYTLLHYTLSWTRKPGYARPVWMTFYSKFGQFQTLQEPG